MKRPLWPGFLALALIIGGFAIGWMQGFPLPAQAQTTTSCPSVIAISQSTGTKLVAGSAGNRFYICSIALTNSNAAVQTVQLVEGTGTVCATGQTVLYNFALGAAGAGPGIGMASPFPFANTQIAGDDLCLLGGAATISGGISFRLQP